ncbi:MAG: hypothetical protein ACRDNE_00925 [Gaiellaceae bacterium]
MIAATGYRRALESLVGHLGVLTDRGEPGFGGGKTDPRTAGLYFVGYAVRLGGRCPTSASTQTHGARRRGGGDSE